jgi:hypothetical protein
MKVCCRPGYDGRILFANQDGKMFVNDPDESGRSRDAHCPNWDPSVCGDGRYIVRRLPGAKKRDMAQVPMADPMHR